MCAATIVLAVGGPLVGRGIFLGGDIIRTFEPWSADTPSTFVYRHGPINDTVDSLVPARSELRKALLDDHRLIIWEPYNNGGGTLDLGLLSPLNWPLLFLGLRLGLAWSGLLRLALAAAAMFAFTRRLGLSRFAAVCGGLIYCTSGFIIAWNNWPQANIAAWIPALFLTADILLERRRARDVAAVAVVVASMLLEGYFPVVVVTAYVIVPFLIVRWWTASRGPTHDRPRFRRRVLDRLKSAFFSGRLLGGAALLGAAIAAFGVLPFLLRLDQVDLTNRGHYGRAVLPAAGLLTSVVPWALGTASQPAHALQAGQFVDSSFLGAAAVVFLVVALARGAPAAVSRGVFRWCTTGAVILLGTLYVSSVGNTSPGLAHNPFKTSVYFLPGMQQVPLSRIRSLFLFLCALLAAFGIEHVVTSTRLLTRRRTLGWWIRVGALTTIGGCLAFLVFDSEKNLATRAGQGSWVVRQSVVPAAIMLVTIVLVFGIRRWGAATRRIAIGAIPVLLAVEALLFTIPSLPRVSSDNFYPEAGSIQYLAAHLGGERYAAAGLMMFPGATPYYGLRSVTGHSFATAAWRELVIVTSPGTYSLPTITILGDSLKVATSPVLDALAAKYFVASPSKVPFGKNYPVPPAARSLAFGGGTIAHGTVPSGPLRAVELTVLGRTQLRGSLDDIDVTVRDPDGRSVASGTLRFRAQDATHTYAVPIAGESLPTTRAPWNVDVALRSPVGDTARLASTDARQVALGFVRPAADGLQLVYADAGAVVYERTSALPRIRWASKTILVDDPTNRIIRMALGGVAPDTVMLSTPSGPASGLDADITVVKDSSDDIRVDVDAAGAGYLVVADAIQHGWVARVDGRVQPIRAADHALGAVRVTAGHHVVHLSASPRGWGIGKALTAAGVIVLALLLVVPPIRRRRARRPHVPSAPGARPDHSAPAGIHTP